MTYTPEDLDEAIRRLTDEPTPEPAAEARSDVWVNDPRHPDGFHKDGVIWHDAPLPWRWHRCRPQSRIVLSSSLRLVERCACGGTRLDGYGPWINRNERRKQR